MKGLTGYLKKTLLHISLFLSFTLLFTHLCRHKIYAQGDGFNTTASFVHTVNGKRIDSELTVKLESNQVRVLSIYTASILAKDITPTCTLEDGSKIACNSYKRTGVTDVQMDLKNRIVSPDNPVVIRYKYSQPVDSEMSFNFPSFLLDAKTTDVKILIPKSMGEYTWASENVTSKQISGNYFEVIFNNPIQQQISLFFTKDIQYEFKISRVFSNQTEQGAQTFELVVPSDTQSQSIIWQDISPLPTSAIMDKDGNYIFKYVVPVKESIDCRISGYIQKNQEKKEEEEIQPFLVKKTGYWDMTDSTEIKRVFDFMRQKGLDINENVEDVNIFKKAQRELFYKYLYQYVIYRLDYEKGIKLGINNEARLGAVQIVKAGQKSTPVDYADFYISLLRYFGVPSRMVLGYVSNIVGYTTDGFYHYWVEFFDIDKKQWVSVDPFLEEYSKRPMFGLTLNDHIEIIKRGQSPLAPTLTFYTPTDFQVSFDDQEAASRQILLEASLSFEKYDPTQKYATAFANISNSGNIAISKVSFDKSNLGKLNSYIDSVSNSGSEILLPKQNRQIQLNIPHERITARKVYTTLLYSNNSGHSDVAMAEVIIPDDVPLYTSIVAKILSLASFLTLLLTTYISFKIIKANRWNQQS